MTLAAVMAGTGLTSSASHPFSIFVDGLDVAKEPAQIGGTAYGTLPDTVTVDEALPGSVSSMDFLIDDPMAEVTITEGLAVRFHANATDLPYFGGYVTSYKAIPVGLGRVWSVSCTGNEAWLDWLKVTTPVTFAASTPVYQAVQSLLAGMSHPLRVAVLSQAGSAEFPTGYVDTTGGGIAGACILLDAVVITAGTTLREALRQISDLSVASGGWVRGGLSKPFYATVDATLGLRLFPTRTFTLPSDYVTVTVIDTPASTLRAEALEHEVDASSVERAVYVKGVNAAASDLFTDGTGLPGDTAFVDDATILTHDDAEAFASSYLARSTSTARGSYRLEDRSTDTPAFHAGSETTVVDALLGLNTQYRVGGITRTFSAGGVPTLEVRYGGPRPSALRTTRFLTRSVKS